MGLVVKQTKIMQLQEEIASITNLSKMAIRMYFSKDAFTKEAGARQSEMLKGQLLRAAARLRMLNSRAYLAQKSSIEELYKALNSCTIKTVSSVKTYEPVQGQTVIYSL